MTLPTNPSPYTYPWLHKLAATLSTRRALFWLLLLAFMVRLAAALVIPLDYRLRDDALEYVSDARHLVTLGIFGEEAGVPYATIPPGYPLFMAAIFVLTNQSLMAVRLGQVLLAALLVWLTYQLGKETAHKQASPEAPEGTEGVIGLGAAVLIAFYPAWVIWTVVFMTETLYTVLLIAFAICFVHSLRAYSPRWTILAGITFGLSLLTREVLFIFPLGLPIALWWARIPWRKAIQYLLLFACATLITLSPWLYRNYRTFGQVFYTERTEAIRYQLTGSGYLAPRYQHLADENAPKRPLKKDAEYYERFGQNSQMTSLSFLRNNPLTYGRYLTNRLIEFWLHPSGLESLPDNFLIRFPYIGFHLLLLLLAIPSLITGLRKRDAAVGGLLLILAYATSSSLFFASPNPRYAIPFLPIVFVFTASGTLWLLRRFLPQKWLPWGDQA